MVAISERILKLNQIKDDLLIGGLQELNVQFPEGRAPTKHEMVMVYERKLREAYPQVQILECETCSFEAPEDDDITACPGCGACWLMTERTHTPEEIAESNARVMARKNFELMREESLLQAASALKVDVPANSSKRDLALLVQKAIGDVHPGLSPLECDNCGFWAPEVDGIVACPGCGERFETEADVVAFEAEMAAHEAAMAKAN